MWMFTSGPHVWCFLTWLATVFPAAEVFTFFCPLNFQKCSGTGVDSMCSRHNLAPMSRLVDPLHAQIIGKSHCFATLIPFRAFTASFFFLLRFSSLIFLFSSLLFFDFLVWLSSLTFPICAFHLWILSGFWLLSLQQLSRTVGSLTSKNAVINKTILSLSKMLGRTRHIRYIKHEIFYNGLMKLHIFGVRLCGSRPSRWAWHRKYPWWSSRGNMMWSRKPPWGGKL